jgi:FtsP/CotA-like multicopper oxidase with cupredoxin domain
MKRFLKLFGLLALLFAVGCNDTPLEPVNPYESNLSLDHPELAFTAEGGSVTVAVTATDSWSATGGAEWSTLSATSGEGDATLTVTAAANTGDARTTSYTFEMGEKSVVPNILLCGCQLGKQEV